MAVSIKNRETERRIRELAALTGESLTLAVDRAVRERLDRLDRERQQIREVLDSLAALPVSDSRPSEELFDELYDEDGLPH